MTDRSPAADDGRILANSAVMAAGTLVSRLSGYVRSTLLAAALGAALHADVFAIANTIPNMLYILLAGGIFNAVLVPQLVRSMQNDEDQGEAYTNRVITLAAVFLGAVTVLLVVGAPWVMSVYLDPEYYTPELAPQLESVIDLARYCLPQVFFYGMFVLVGQVLNARGRFGPMMWAPIANNVIAVAVLIVYLFVFGPARSAGLSGGYTPDQELLLGLGSTAGIAAQFAILVPYLRAAGLSYRPRFDFAGTGLGHTLRLGAWTVLFVVVNQVAYTVVVRLASSGTAEAALSSGRDGEGTGYAVYAATFLIVMVPHSIVTVSLATAILPRLSQRAAAGDFTGLAATLAGTVRNALAVVVPFAMLLPVLAPDLANVIWRYGAASGMYQLYILSLSLFGMGLVFFTVHYLVLRGFYALERTRTVFFIQCAVAATNIAVAVALVTRVDPLYTTPALVVAYAASYLVGAAVSYVVLSRALGGLQTSVSLRYLVRLLAAAAVSTLVAYAGYRLTQGVGGHPAPHLVAAARALVITIVDVGVFLIAARLLAITEVTDMVSSITQRLPGIRNRR